MQGRATGADPVRGAHLDNTDLANVLLEDLWDVSNHRDTITVTVSPYPSDAAPLR